MAMTRNSLRAAFWTSREKEEFKRYTWRLTDEEEPPVDYHFCATVTVQEATLPAFIEEHEDRQVRVLKYGSYPILTFDRGNFKLTVNFPEEISSDANLRKSTISPVLGGDNSYAVNSQIGLIISSILEDYVNEDTFNYHTDFGDDEDDETCVCFHMIKLNEATEVMASAECSFTLSPCKDTKDWLLSEWAQLNKEGYELKMNSDTAYKNSLAKAVTKIATNGKI